jgi:hypothetical protein
VIPNTGALHLGLHPLSKAIYLSSECDREIQDTSFTLERLYKLLTTEMIEVVELGDGNILIIDEEGKCLDLRKNKEATALCSPTFQREDYIAGPAILCPSSFLQ